MHFKKIIAQIVGASAIIVLTSGSAYANLLTNPGFEDPDLSSGGADINCDGGNCPGWQSYQAWGGPFIVDERTDANASLPAHGGDQKLKAFGPNSGVFQDFAVSPGDTAGGSAWAGSTVGIGDDMTGVANVAIEWLSGGVNLGLTSFGTSYDPSVDPAGTWKLLTVAGTAPATADTARFVLNVNSSVGAGFFDDADFTTAPGVIPVPAAVWLFGSGLLGLVGVARRRKA